jgi:1-deoxy-D-xylulose-5-phosphate synthase
VTSAAGLAMGGLHPVVALYATFLNRAFDQLLLDVALHRCGVTFVLDRAGVTGPDGPSHHGMWDMSLLQLVPGLRLAAPRDATRLREALDVATQVDDGPTVVRYSKDAVPADLPALEVVDGLDVLLRAETAPPQVLVVAFGQMVGTGLEVGRRLTDHGVGVTVVDPVWALPVNPALLTLAQEHELVVTIEDNGIVGGCGARLAQELRQAGIATPLREFGIEQEFLEHGTRAELLAQLGLAPQDIARTVVETIVAQESTLSPDTAPRNA